MDIFRLGLFALRVQTRSNACEAKLTLILN
jgi:hypothetical protein